jgi:predicted GNAT family acetyltransferase
MEPFTILNNEKEQQFQVRLEGEMASLEYRMNEGKIVLMHTEVPEKLGGRGIASALAKYGMDYARAHHFPVKVYCPFVQTWLKRHPEEMDIVVQPREGSGRQWNDQAGLQP